MTNNTQLPAEAWVMPADKVAFMKDAVVKLKASNRSDYESGDFDITNHKQETRYKTFEEVLQWLNPATEYASKIHQVEQENKELKQRSNMAIQLLTTVSKQCTMRRALLTEIKTFLDGTGA